MHQKFFFDDFNSTTYLLNGRYESIFSTFKKLDKTSNYALECCWPGSNQGYLHPLP